MKRYNFYVFFLMLFFNKAVFCVDVSNYSVVLFDKNDVAKYWLVKQLTERHSKNVLSYTINNVLISLKKPIELSRAEFFETEPITCKWIENDRIRFRFGNVPNSKVLDFAYSEIVRPIPLVTQHSELPELSDWHKNVHYDLREEIAKIDVSQSIDIPYRHTKFKENDNKFLPSPIVLSVSKKNAKPVDEEKSIDEFVMPLKYRSDPNWDGNSCYDSYVDSKNEKELPEGLTKVLIDLVKEKLEISQTWPSWVDPDDID